MIRRDFSYDIFDHKRQSKLKALRVPPIYFTLPTSVPHALASGEAGASVVVKFDSPQDDDTCPNYQVLSVTPRFPKYDETESRRESATYIRKENTPRIHAKPKLT